MGCTQLGYTNMKALVLASLSTLVLGGGVGYYFGKADTPETAEVVTEGQRSQSGERSTTVRIERQQERRSYESIMRESSQSDRILNLVAYYQSLGPDEFLEEAEKVGRLPMSERFLAGYLLYARWGEVAPMEAIDHSRTLGFASRFVQPTILSSWAIQDPVRAAEYYSENQRDFVGGRRRGGDAGANIAKEWARQDPDAALAWAQGLSGNARTSAESAVFGELAVDDPAKAAAQLDASPDLEGREAAARRIAGQWGATDFAAAKQWASSMTGEARDRALSEAVEGLATVDSLAAADEALALPEGRWRNEALESVAEEMSRENGAGAIAWLEQNGGDELLRDSMREVMPNWVAQDETAALAWVQSREEGGVRDRAAASYVFANQNADGREVIEIAQSIGDERSRNRSTRFAAEQWLATDPDGARSYIESAEGIDDNLRERLLD